MRSAALVAELKKALKGRAITYATLAARLELSEAAVKRLFSEGNFSLQRLDAICDAAEIDLGELFRAAERQRSKPEPLTLEVEAELARDDQLVLALYLILLKFPLKARLSELAVDKAGYYRLCRRLEKLGLVEVHAQDKVVARVSKAMRWLPGGPLIQRFGGALQAEFFASQFTAEDEHQDFLTGALSTESWRLMKRRLQEVFREFEAISDLDEAGDESQREVFWLYAGMRPWAPVDVIKRLKS